MKFLTNLFTPRKTVQWYNVFTGMNNPHATLGDIQQSAAVWKFEYYVFNGKVYPTSKQGSIDVNEDFYCRLEDIRC